MRDDSERDRGHAGAGHRRRGTGRRSTELQQPADVPLDVWAYRVTDVHRAGDRATADVELRYRIKGYDNAPMSPPAR